MGDRFFGTVNLIEYCKERNWDYRLRLKGNLTVCEGMNECKAADLAQTGPYFLENATLTGLREQTNIAIVQEAEHPEAWMIAMKQKRNYSGGKNWV
jgi:hypothetical protein